MEENLQQTLKRRIPQKLMKLPPQLYQTCHQSCLTQVLQQLLNFHCLLLQLHNRQQSFQILVSSRQHKHTHPLKLLFLQLLQVLPLQQIKKLLCLLRQKPPKSCYHNDFDNTNPFCSKNAFDILYSSHFHNKRNFSARYNG
ncbi:hypothetical protein JZ751_026092 [Albula glossodonta]|uniref:Uncharacterized protein n=1 Tax=Albula glossodonta TaxID=121402 RepID=A0A8T2MQ85_9TELE|nr:hypothetical protein JZ751_026092 [Albula glossodonta]